MQERIASANKKDLVIPAEAGIQSIHLKLSFITDCTD